MSAAGTRWRCMLQCLGLRKKKQQKGQKESSQGCGGTMALCCFPCLSLRPSPHQLGCVWGSPVGNLQLPGVTQPWGCLQWPSHPADESSAGDIGSRGMLPPLTFLAFYGSFTRSAAPPTPPCPPPSSRGCTFAGIFNYCINEGHCEHRAASPAPTAGTELALHNHTAHPSSSLGCQGAKPHPSPQLQCAGTQPPLHKA